MRTEILKKKKMEFCIDMQIIPFFFFWFLYSFLMHFWFYSNLFIFLEFDMIYLNFIINFLLIFADTTTKLYFRIQPFVWFLEDVVWDHFVFLKHFKLVVYQFYYQIHGFYHFNRKLIGNKQLFGQMKDSYCR